jgi:hypothetical protein
MELLMAAMAETGMIIPTQHLAYLLLGQEAVAAGRP